MGEGLGRLWAGWRGEYVAGVLGDGDEASAPPDGDAVEGDEAGRADGDRPCVFCRILTSGEPDADTYVVWRGERCAALLNAYPYTSGHLMVLPLRHVGELEDLAPEEAGELWRAVTDAVVALKGAYGPGGVNLGANLGRAAGAGIPGHAHVHVLPRWNGDTNFMTSVAELRVLPEALPTTWDKLRRAWPAGGRAASDRR